MKIHLLAPMVCLVLAGGACSSSSSPSTPSRTDTQAPAPVPTPVPPPASAASTARYRATFRASWANATHPNDFPGSSAHFSPLVGGTHSDRVTFWREGALATLGIQDMAERGLTFRLVDEINAAIGAGSAERAFTGESIGTSPGTATADFEVSQSFPAVTLVSMIAPSPDWFVGVSGLRLFDNGRWLDETTVDLVPWDAGTDSGATFTSPDFVTAPHVPIARIVTAPLSPAGRVTPLGTFTFTRLP